MSEENYVKSEIERMELEKIAKSEMEEDIALFRAVDAIVCSGTCVDNLTSDEIRTIRQYNRRTQCESGDYTPEPIFKTIERFKQRQDANATMNGWNGVDRTPNGSPLLSERTVDPSQPWLKDLSANDVTKHLRDMKDGIGIRYDKGKHRHATLLPVLWIRRLTEILEYGAKKYTDQNWKGLDVENCINSGMRHLLDVVESMQDGKDTMCRDEESNLYHIYQAAWNLLAAGYIMENQGNLPINSAVKTITINRNYTVEGKEVQMIRELEEMLDRRLKDDETTLYASDIYALIERYKNPHPYEGLDLSRYED